MLTNALKLTPQSVRFFAKNNDAKTRPICSAFYAGVRLLKQLRRNILEIWMYILSVPVLFVGYFLLKGIFQGAVYYDIDPRNTQDIRAISGIAQVQKMIEENDYSYEQVSKVLAQSKQIISRESYLFVKSMVSISPELDELALTWEQWYEMFKKESAKINPQLAIDEEGLSLVDMMDDGPLKNAYNDQQNPLVIAKEFAEGFDISSFGQQQ